MQLYFIRHGQSTNNALYDRNGPLVDRSYDPDLTDIGRQQAKQLAHYLSHHSPPGAPDNPFGITHVYSSLMIRAVDTAYEVASALGLPLYGWLDIHEEGGLFLDDEEHGARIGKAGRNRAAFEARCPNMVVPDVVGDAGWWNRPYEPPDVRADRAQRVVNTLMHNHGGSADCVAMVSHGGFYNWLLAALLGLPAPERYWFTLNNTGITRIDFSGEMLTLKYLNRVDFLSDDLIT